VVKKSKHAQLTVAIKASYFTSQVRHCASLLSQRCCHGPNTACHPLVLCCWACHGLSLQRDKTERNYNIKIKSHSLS